MKHTYLIGAVLLAQFFPGLCAMAHPGHGLVDHGPLHVITSPYHLVVLALTGGAFLVAARFVNRELPRRLLQGAGVAAFLTAALIWGIR